MAIYDINGSALTDAYDINGSALTNAYDINGNAVYVKKDYSNPTITSLKTISTSNTQGMEIYNDVLFQFRGSTSNTSINDLVCVYDWTDGTSLTSNLAIESGHANAVTFDKTLQGDFPLLYCGDWFDPIVHVNQVTSTSATHLYDIVMDVATTGYYPNPAIDFDNNILYTVGYYQHSTTVSTDNYCIVCAWDLSNMTDNGDDTYTPTLISTYTRDYIYVMQDLKFNDGYIWICSGYSSSTQYVSAMIPSTGVFDYQLTMPIKTEIEGISWQTDADGKYFAYIGFQGGKYYTMTF